ncbi:MAG: 4Fe-4S dicluster domain-containing protein [Helicobacter sp.]|nr:4Fe-4S dicluster domain-containing protein [Helicobacter sp.]
MQTATYFSQNIYKDFLENDFFSPQQQEILHEVNETRLDFLPLYTHKSVFIKPRITVVGSGELVDSFLERLVESKAKEEFVHFADAEIFHLLPQNFLGLNGNLGNFGVLYTDTASQTPQVLEVAQVVFFTRFDNVPSIKGVHWVSDYPDQDSLIALLHKNCGSYEYQAPIVFDPNLCDYQHRRIKKDGSGYCLACVDTCSVRGVFHNEKKVEINLSGMDCVACGECVSVCPTGALYRESESLESLSFQARVCKDYVLLVHAEEAVQEILSVLRASSHPFLLPFIIGQPNILNETYLLSLVQESASTIILYTQAHSVLQKSVDAINNLSQAIFGLDCVLLVQDKSQLESALKQASRLPQAYFIYTPRRGESLKEVFAQRAHAWVRNNNFGKIDFTHSADIQITEDCTLCLSCVEACNTNALINNNSSFELLFKHALCTGCGYCVDTCAEKVISMQSNVLDARGASFAYVQKAKDDPFKCVECGKIFATSKSIMKIKNLLFHAFEGDLLKQRSIECCADCKVKLIFGPKENS